LVRGGKGRKVASKKSKVNHKKENRKKQVEKNGKFMKLLRQPKLHEKTEGPNQEESSGKVKERRRRTLFLRKEKIQVPNLGTGGEILKMCEERKVNVFNNWFYYPSLSI